MKTEIEPYKNCGPSTMQVSMGFKEMQEEIKRAFQAGMDAVRKPVAKILKDLARVTLSRKAQEIKWGDLEGEIKYEKIEKSGLSDDQISLQQQIHPYKPYRHKWTENVPILNEYQQDLSEVTNAFNFVKEELIRTKEREKDKEKRLDSLEYIHDILNNNMELVRDSVLYMQGILNHMRQKDFSRVELEKRVIKRLMSLKYREQKLEKWEEASDPLNRPIIDPDISEHHWR